MMAGTASDFLPASDLPASPSREQELEELVRSQAAIIERISEMLDSSGQAGPGRAAPDGQTEKRLRALEARAAWSHEEKQALIEKISDLSEAVQDLESSVKKIVDMKNVNDRIEERIIDVKDLAKTKIGELENKIVDISKNQTVDSNFVKDLEEDMTEAQNLLNQHAEAINKIWQLSKKQRTATGKKSVARIEQIKDILKAGPRTYKELERLLGVSAKEMNRLISMMDARQYEIFYRAGDNRQKVLRLRAWNASQQSKSLTSSVNYPAGGGGMGP